MDFQKFSDENFEVKDWINNALRAHKDAGVSLDAHASNIVMKLQLFIQEVNKSLEETSQIAVNNLPRVLREVEGIKCEALNLKEQMQMVKDDIRQIEENTSQSMKTLMDIDNIKERLQAASSALQEADNWTTLSSDVDEIFLSGNVDEIAGKLIGMQKSLNVLQDVPDFAERKRLLESLKNRLEALLSTKLVAAFNSHLLDEAKKYVQIFTEIGRLEQIQTYYNNCHKGNLLKVWNELREDPTNAITIWLPKFFENLLSLWHKEVVWCAQVFKDPVSVLSPLLVQILVHLEPPISQCITESMAGEEVSLSLLIELKEISCRLINGLESSLKAMPAYSSSSKSFIDLITAIQEPHTSYLLRYSEIQQSELMTRIGKMNLELSNFADTVSCMSESVGQAFRSAQEAKDCCWQFTDGYGTLGVLEALKNFFSAYLGQLDGLINELRRISGINGSPSDDVTADEDQWTNFQNSFKIIEMCGILSIKMADFRDNFTKEIKEKLQIIFEKENSNWLHNFNYLEHSRSSEYEDLREFHERIDSYELNVVLASTTDQIERLNEHAHRFAFDVVFVHLRRKLELIPKLEIWSTDSTTKSEIMAGDLPIFSLSPQSCITDVGDYLLTLPQQLEPFFSHENTSLLAALKTGQIPYADKQDADVDHDHYWVIGFAKGTMNLFVENILKIPELTTKNATQQLIADIDYLCNIFEAVEVHPNDQLKSIKELLNIEANSFHELASEISAEEQIENTIARMRKI